MKEKIIGFFTDVTKEMSKVTWPKKEELRESTIVVMVVVSGHCGLRLRRGLCCLNRSPNDSLSTRRRAVDKKWYVVRTYSGHENKVKAYIENEIAQAGLAEMVGSVVVPSEKVFEVKDGKKKSKTRTFFPGYILIEAVLDKTTQHIILNTPSVISFVGPRNAPAPLQASEVRRLIGRIEERKEVEVIEVPFRVGDAVKVMEGPFNNFSGFVQEVNEEKMKVKVMVSIFGRKTPVELDFSQVELEK